MEKRPEKKLLERVRDAIRVKHYSIRGYSSKLWGTLGNGAVDLLPGPLETATV